MNRFVKPFSSFIFYQSVRIYSHFTTSFIYGKVIALPMNEFKFPGYKLLTETPREDLWRGNTIWPAERISDGKIVKITEMKNAVAVDNNYILRTTGILTNLYPVTNSQAMIIALDKLETDSREIMRILDLSKQAVYDTRKRAKENLGSSKPIRRRAGRYMISDPTDVLTPEHYADLIYNYIGPLYTYETGDCEIIVFSTKGGDGRFDISTGWYADIETGLVAVVPVEYLEKRGIEPDGYRVVLERDGDFEFRLTEDKAMIGEDYVNLYDQEEMRRR